LRHLDRAIGSLETEATRLATARTELDREIAVVRSAEQDEAQAEVAHGEARNDLVRAWDELAGAWAAAAQLDEPSDGSAHGGGVPGDPASRTPPRPALPDAADLADLQATRLDALEQHQAELGRRARAWAEQIERGEVKARSRVEALENRLTVRAETRSRLEAERIPAAEDLDRQLMAAGIEVERTRETLMRLRDELQAEEPELDRARVAAEGALESARQRARDLADAVRRRDEARRRSEVWLQLHDLIGKGEGKRFKEFAQALNLGQLLERANRHLARLNERYRLIPVHDDETGLPTLEFELADGWRPGSTRSIRTLSGGESFLVSLALALGLSDLRTSSMPIETLLLDEGFGTLDRETLDVALAALQQLQADGRQIGIISHVAGLEDRIDARIHVEPLGNGRSRVRVGVQR
jgi:exonuclease SbcC